MSRVTQLYLSIISSICKRNFHEHNETSKIDGVLDSDLISMRETSQLESDCNVNFPYRMFRNKFSCSIKPSTAMSIIFESEERVKVTGKQIIHKSLLAINSIMKIYLLRDGHTSFCLNCADKSLYVYFVSHFSLYYTTIMTTMTMRMIMLFENVCKPKCNNNFISSETQKALEGYKNVVFLSL